MDLLGAGGCACELWGFFNPFWPVNVGINYQPTSLTGESYRISEPSTVSNVYVMSLWFIIPILPGVVIFIPDKKTMPSTVVPFHSFFPHQFWVVLRIPRHSFWYAPFRSAKSSYPWRGISDGGEIALVVSLDGWKSWWTYQKAGGFKCKMKDFRFVYIYMYIYIYTLPETNIAPKSGWLEDDVCFRKGIYTFSLMLTAPFCKLVFGYRSTDTEAHNRNFDLPRCRPYATGPSTRHIFTTAGPLIWWPMPGVPRFFFGRILADVGVGKDEKQRLERNHDKERLETHVICIYIQYISTYNR